jgi:hypothetical protein
VTTPQPDPPDADALDWDSTKFGKMADYATDPEDEPETVPYEPEDGSTD